MKNIFSILLFAGLLFFSKNSFGTIIHSNTCASATSGWTYTNAGTAIQQPGYWLLDDGDVIISQAFDVSSYTGGLTLNFKVATYGSGTPDKPILVEYSENNGGSWSTTTFTSTTPTTSTFVASGTFSISASSATQFKFRFKKASTLGRSGVRLDDILFEGTIPTYTVTYDGNLNDGGTVPTDASSPYTSGSTVTVKTKGTMTKTGYIFDGWDTDNDGIADYTGSGSETFSILANTTLKAVWTVNVTPTLAASALTPFGSKCIGSTYGPNSFKITGTSLTTADVTIAALSGYTYSTTSGGTYTSSLTLTQSGGSYSQDIFVKFSPTAAIAYTDNIVVGGGGASDINVAASGTGINTASTITTPTSTAIATTTATLGGNITSIGCSNATVRGIEWSTTNNFTNGTGTQVSSSGTFSTGVYTQAVTGLPSSTTIYFKAYCTNGGGTVYTAQSSFVTHKVEPAAYPSAFNCGTTTINTIPLTWTDASTAQVPNGYLIKWSNTSYAAISDPVDGTAEADGAGVKNIAQGVQTYTATGLTSATTYFFKIWSYTNSGTNINYKLVSEPQTSCATLTIPNLVITEFAGSGYGGDFNNEYIEISNLGITSASLSGWTLEYYNNSSLEATVTLSGTLAANTAYVIAARSSYNPLAITPDIVASPNFYMNSTGYAVLKLGTTIIDQAAKSTGLFLDNKNYELTNCTSDNSIVANWDDLGTSNGTPGIVNCCTPPTQATSFSSSALTVNSGTANWLRGTGDNVLVVAREGGAVNADPKNGTAYTANAVFGSGTEIGTGNFVVYNGSGTSVNITGLNSNTIYYFAVYEYKTAGNCYNKTELTGNFTTPVPTIDLNSPNPAVAVANLTQNTTNNVIYKFDLTATGNATLNNISFTTAGTYVAANLTNIKLWYSTDATFSSGTDVLLATKTTNLKTNPQTFTAFSRAIADGTTGYFFLTTDLPCGATSTNTLSVNALTTADLTFITGTKTGIAYIGGTQTFVLASPNNVTAQTTSACTNGGTTVSWTLPTGCYSDVMVVATSGSFTGAVPTNNLFTPNASFGIGTAFDGGFVVYQGSGTSVNVTNLTNGTNYTYKIFTRNLTNWSSGVITSCTPILAYCTAASTNTANEFIEGVEFNTINNPSPNTTYTDYYPTVSTTVEKGETYPITVYNGDYWSSDILLVWIDWNQDGDFIDIGEQVVTTISGASAPYTVNITIPTGLGAKLGSTRMRLRLYDGTLGTPNPTPCGTHTYGEVEDYKITIVEPCVPTHTFTSFTPTTGPEGTYVTINGTGFSASTTVSFNKITSTDIEFVSATQIIARVPAGNTTGIVRVTEASCAIKSGSNFTKIDKSGSCTAAVSYTDLIISEVYDADAYNVAYIELYNPTSSPINLATANYSIGVDNNTSAFPVSIDRTINLTGIVPAGGVFLCSFGTSANTCTNTWDLTVGGSGWNADDNLFLIKNGVQVDRVNTPSNKGFSILRKATASGPTTTFNAADWIISSTESCADLGVAPVTTYNNPATVLTNTLGCSVNMSVVVTEGNATPSGDLTYKWYYNDGTAVGWTQVTGSAPFGYTITGTTTNNLIIASNTKDIYLLDKYQFYCEVTEAGTCKNVSTGNRFKVNSRPVYRSVAASNGNWTTVANWEMAMTPAGPWVSACTYPNARNSSEAIIQAGTTIVLDIDNDIDKLTVEATATLEDDINSQLTIYDSVPAGADFIMNGTFIYRANSTNSLTFGSGAKWIFGVGATFIKTNTASADNFRTGYFGGMSNMPSTGKWIYRYNGDNTSVITAAAGFYYPDLYFENTATTGLFDFNSGTMQLSGNTIGSCTVKGNMYVGTTGTGKVKIYNNNINLNPHTIVGNLEIGTGSTFTNALCSGCGAANSSSDAGTGINLGGNLVNGGSLDINSPNGSAVNTGILRFNGIGTQTVSGIGTFDLWNVELDKTIQTLVDQQVNLTANNNLNFVGGILKTSNNVFTVANGSISNAVTGFETPYIGASTPAYVNDRYIWGYLERLINTNGIYVYPVGDGLTGEAYNPLRFSVNGGTGTGTYATANFIPGDPGSCVAGPIYFSCSGSNNFLQYSDMTSEGKWRMSSSTSSTFDFDIYLHPNQNNANVHPNEDVTAYPLFFKNNYRALKVPTGTADWSPYVQLGDECIIGSYYNIPGVGYSGFSDFAPGGGSGNTTALPVELTSFVGTCLEDGISKITWSTASEFNSKQFIVQRSEDGIHYTQVAAVLAADLSNQPKNYSITDTSANANSNYYRLIEVDNNNRQTIYAFIQVKCNEVNGVHIFYTQPRVVVEVNSTKDKPLGFSVYEVSGKLIYQESKQVTRGYNHFDLGLKNKLADGIYIIQMIDDDKATSTKVMVH